MSLIVHPVCRFSCSIAAGQAGNQIAPGFAIDNSRPTLHQVSNPLFTLSSLWSQSILKSTKEQLEFEQQAVSALQAELTTAQQQQDATHRALQEESMRSEDCVRKVASF